MKRFAIILATLAVLAGCCKSADTHLKRDFQSFDQTMVGSMLKAVTLKGGTDEIHAFMVIKDGKVVAEHYDTGFDKDHLFKLWSGSKTFTAAAIGFARQEGLLSLDDPVLKFFEEERPDEPSERLQALTVKHLLCMASGFTDDFAAEVMINAEPEAAKRVLNGEFSWNPGEHFYYNSMNSYLLSAIITKLTGQTVAEYLTPRLFEPLGIRDWVYDSSVEGYSFGGWGLHMTTESFGKMGLFYLQKGMWEGKRLLEEKWFDEAMAPQILQYGHLVTEENADEWAQNVKDDDWNQGYGYQMWCCTHGASRLDGAWGQFSIIIPDKNAVVVINSHSRHTKDNVKAVWEHIYPYL